MPLETGGEGAQSPADIMAEFAALSVDTGEPETSSRDYDKFLYAENDGQQLCFRR